ncbi:MAG TPA: hypothetical protein VF829_00420 [Candidatus Paceibacterota bacterium]
MDDEKQRGDYDKRPVWQWVLLYIVIGGIIYAIVYYLFIAPGGGYQAPTGGYPATSTYPGAASTSTGATSTSSPGGY